MIGRPMSNWEIFRNENILPFSAEKPFLFIFFEFVSSAKPLERIIESIKYDWNACCLHISHSEIILVLPK